MLDKQYLYEKILSQLSTNFIALPANKIEDAVNESLKTIGEFMAVDRVFVDQFSLDESEFRMTHLWCALDTPLDAFELNVVLSEHWPWFTQKMLRGEPLVFTSPDEIPKEAKNEHRYFTRAGIKSSAIVPMVIDELFVGHLGFDMLRSQAEWTDAVLR